MTKTKYKILKEFSGPVLRAGGGKQVAPQRPLLTVDEFARLSGWAPKTIRQKIWKRELPFVRMGRSIRFKPELLETMIAAGSVDALEAQK